ncbi:CoA transferase [Amycolatopsis sp.]|jgi:crotonobetainyl-CoA:carnitine CoA-transferase CaiB-like acyl-CoA transferase|uniref:CaiB/BaiF CoA transferase family protein n=1 Tax=Amycolatopsis sp. TaxID=37632 RepID=UPI002E06C60E|nr:CoA transferase [Amycolatopsis sp.]
MTASTPVVSGGGPLLGVRVLDLTTFLSGPSASQLLGDLGADVIKVEAPEGDMTRTVPPYFVGPDSAYYLANNRNKSSIVINLKTAEGCRLLERLAGEVDIVIENYRPGVLKRLGLAVPELLVRHPALIWASISGFGQDGPWCDRPAYDLIVQALSGAMSLTGEPDGRPVRLGIPVGDLVAGLYAVIGLLAAWADRLRSGSGRWVDVAMLDSQLAMLSYQAVYNTVGGVTPAAQGNRHDSIPTYRTFVGSDGRELAVTASTQRMFEELCHALGLPELIDDPRFVDPAGRLANRVELWELLEKEFAAAPAAAWVERLGERRVPAALIKNVPEAIQDARESDRGMVREMTHPDGRRVEVLGNPVKFRGEPRGELRYPPPLGEHTSKILTNLLGLPSDHIAHLTADGVIYQGPG